MGANRSGINWEPIVPIERTDTFFTISIFKNL
jgi:hypothetical protein